MKTADQIAAKYVTNTGQARQSYIDGINGTTVNPMEMAASDESTALYLNNVQASVSSGRRQAKLRSIPQSAWKDGAIKKGADRLATGAQAARSKVLAHFQKWGPIYDRVHQEVSQMPKGGAANAKARSAKAIDILMEAAGRT